MTETPSFNKHLWQTILVVNHDPSFRKIIRDALAGEGFIVTEAGNGDEAIASARRHFPDLILVDAIMDSIYGKPFSS